MPMDQGDRRHTLGYQAAGGRASGLVLGGQSDVGRMGRQAVQSFPLVWRQDGCRAVVRRSSGGGLLVGGCGRRASEPEAATRGWGSPRFGCEAGRRPEGGRAVWRAPVGPEAPTREWCAASGSYSAPEEVRPFGQRQPLSASLPNTTAVDQATALGGARKAVLSARRSVGRWPLGRTQARAGEVPGLPFGPNGCACRKPKSGGRGLLLSGCSSSWLDECGRLCPVLRPGSAGVYRGWGG